MMRYLFLGSLMLSCTHSGVGGGDAPVAASPQKAAASVKPAASVAAKPAVETCQVFAQLPSEPPVVLTGKNVVLTRLLKPCVTHAGQRGYEQTTPYLAMGFPCTGGSGRIERKGHYNNPKMVTFVLGTDCPMAPSGREQVQSLIDTTFSLPVTTKLVSYTPFVVQYWEVPAMSDADIGYALELRSAPAVEGLWRKFMKQEPVRVHLYGRENTWVPGDHFYFVEADLVQSGRNSFALAVVKVKPLGKDEIASVKQRCEALRPKRPCGDVF